MNFNNPIFLWLLILIPFYWGIIFYKKFFKYKKSLPNIEVAFFMELKKAQGFSIYKYYNLIKISLESLLLMILILAIARPMTEHEITKINKNGVDIIFAVDISGSMLATDIYPNRLEATKKYISEFVTKLDEDRVGIVVFAGKTFTTSPLTFDYGIVTTYLKDLTSIDRSVNLSQLGLQDMYTIQKTAIGSAIYSVINRFKQIDNPERTKILILFTDGVSNAGQDPRIAALKLKKEGIKFYVIGVGNKNQQILDRQGGSFDSTELQKLATLAGGKYFTVNDHTTFEKVLQVVKTAEKKKIEIELSIEYKDNFIIFLLSSFLVMIIYLFWIMGRRIYI